MSSQNPAQNLQDTSLSPTVVPMHTDLPPLPPDFSALGAAPAGGQGSASEGQSVPSQNSIPPVDDSGSAAPSDLPPMVTSSPKKKFGTGKIIATILGIFLLVGGVAGGVLLTQQNQNVSEKADCRSGLNPDGSLDDTCLGPVNLDQPPTLVDNQTQSCEGSICNVYDSGGNLVGEYRINSNNEGDGTACQLPNCPPGTTRGALISSYCVDRFTMCYYEGTQTKVIPRGCGDNGHQDRVEVYECAGSASAQCQNIKAYSEDWVLLTSAQLALLGPTDKVNFCVAGTASEGTFDMAKFTINGAVQAETTTVRPTTTDDFCQLYTLPASVTTFNVTAQIHHATLGWK